MTGQISYRRTQRGDWVVMGPVSQVQPRSNVTVTKKDGSTKVEFITKVGSPFSTAQGQMVYGYLAPRTVRTESDLEDDWSFTRSGAWGRTYGR